MSKIYEVIKAETEKSKKSFVASFKKWQEGKTHLEMGIELKEELEKMDELIGQMFLAFRGGLTLDETSDLRGDVTEALFNFNDCNVSDKDVAIAYVVKMIRPKIEKAWKKIHKEAWGNEEFIPSFVRAQF